MKISVVIPTHNREKELRRAIDSVLNQAAKPEEIIVVDDGSEEEALDVLHEYNEKGIKVFRQLNRGVSAARNKGIEVSKGDWISFLDSDDWWLPGKLEEQINFHVRFPELLISQTDEIWLRNGVRINPRKYHLKRGGWIFDLCLERCMITPSAVLINKRIFEEIGMFDECLPACEDYDLWLRIAHKYPVGLIDEKLVVKTGGHSDQLSGKYWGMDRFRIKSLEKLLENTLDAEKEMGVLDVLIRKASILAQGSQKRNELERAGLYQLKAEKYRLALERLGGTYKNKSQS